jgi:hypothetical protein
VDSGIAPESRLAEVVGWWQQKRAELAYVGNECGGHFSGTPAAEAAAILRMLIAALKRCSTQKPSAKIIIRNHHLQTFSIIIIQTHQQNHSPKIIIQIYPPNLSPKIATHNHRPK